VITAQGLEVLCYLSDEGVMLATKSEGLGEGKKRKINSTFCLSALERVVSQFPDPRTQGQKTYDGNGFKSQSRFVLPIVSSEASQSSNPAADLASLTKQILGDTIYTYRRFELKVRSS
jgi:hypothetical protein